MKIGEVAAAAKVTVETVRFYERERLLHPAARLSNGYRAYGAKHVDRLLFIRNCRSLDVRLDEIRTLIGLLDDPASECATVDHVVDHHLRQVRARIASLRSLERQLGALRARCAAPGAARACGILGELAKTGSDGESPGRPIK